MNLSCEIVRDLLPLYIDGVAAKESEKAVEEHLESCPDCKRYYHAMKGENELGENQSVNLSDIKMVDSLKKVKKKITKKTRTVIACAASAVLVVILGFNLLFNIPIKTLDAKDVKVDVKTYALSDLEKQPIGDNEIGAAMYADENDESQAYRIIIPDSNADISMTENLINKDAILSVTTWESPYFIREIRYSDKSTDDVLYIDSIKTTVFNNKIGKFSSSTNIDFRSYAKIVYIHGGHETVLWSK